MTPAALTRLRPLEGRIVSLSLADGRRLDGVQLVSLPLRGLQSFWLFVDGEDRFVPADDVVDVWECRDPSHSAA
jgi:hypothetical protein